MLVALPLEENPGTHQKAGKVGSRAILDTSGEEKISCPWHDLNPGLWTMQPVASHYTNFTVLAFNRIGLQLNVDPKLQLDLVLSTFVTFSSRDHFNFLLNHRVWVMQNSSFTRMHNVYMAVHVSVL
jgi:hypothetical protein